MIEELKIRESLESDLGSIENLYPDAFPDEDLLPVVKELLADPSNVLSLVGTMNRELVGHIILTICSLTGRTDKVALLGPLAVAPAWQRKGIGSALIREGFRLLEESGAIQVCVLGDPAYYSHLGFMPEADVTPPYPLPEEWRGAWQAITLRETGQPIRGELSVPEPWRKSALWTS